MRAPRVALLISGGGSNMQTLVQSMQAEGYAEPALVVSNVPGAGGLDKAQALGVPTVVVDHRDFPKDKPAFESALKQALNAAAPDLICLAGFMRVLSADFVNAYPERILNIHPSLLPKYKGLNTHARAIEAGDKDAGCSVHVVTAALDDGPVLGQARVPVNPGDTPDTLAARVLQQEHSLYPTCLKKYVNQNAAWLTGA